jgi:tetratricopeptide (TPR) repeat protein
MNKVLLTSAVAIAIGFAVLFGGVFRDASESAPAALVGPQTAENFKAGFSLGGDTASLVLQLQSTLRANASDEHSWALLGLAYEQRARETGDPSYYTKADGALQRARGLDSNDYLIYAGLGSLALSRHRFGEALQLGREARALSPSTAQSYGVIGDALVELGRYRDGFHSFDTMATLRPSLASYARISYARELLGHTKAAIAAMKLAISAAVAETEPTAWTHVQLGKLYFNHGRYTAAARQYRVALAVFPGYAYGYDALAQAEAARGHVARAIALERYAVAAIPLPQYVAFLGDLYTSTGNTIAARHQYALIDAIQKLLRANGVKTDLELALFDVDHGLDLPRALRLARTARAERPSIDADDVLAWALSRNGHCREALGYSKRALRLGTLDALKFFHRGMIERCLGNEAASRLWLTRAVDLSPHFSVHWAPVARRALG